MYILYSIPYTASCLYRSVPSLIHIAVYTYSSSLYTCVYKVVVVELLGKITRWLLLHCRNYKHMIGLTETWLKPDEFTVLNEASPPGYTSDHIPCASRKGGGVANDDS